MPSRVRWATGLACVRKRPGTVQAIGADAHQRVTGDRIDQRRALTFTFDPAITHVVGQMYQRSRLLSANAIHPPVNGSEFLF